MNRCCWIILGKLNKTYTAVEEYSLAAVLLLEFATIPEDYVLCCATSLTFENASRYLFEIVKDGIISNFTDNVSVC